MFEFTLKYKLLLITSIAPVSNAQRIKQRHNKLKSYSGQHPEGQLHINTDLSYINFQTHTHLHTHTHLMQQ